MINLVSSVILDSELHINGSEWLSSEIIARMKRYAKENSATFSRRVTEENDPMWKLAFIECRRWVSNYRNYYEDDSAIGIDIPLWGAFCDACGGENRAITYCEEHYEEW